MIEQKNKEIDGRAISTTPFLGRRSLAYKMKIIRLFGPAVGSLFSKAGGFDGTIDFSVLESAIDKLSTNIDDKVFVEFCLELLSSTRIDGKEITPEFFDVEFSANLVLMYKILGFILEVNYGNFFGAAGIGKILSEAKTAIPAAIARQRKSPKQ